MNLANFPISYTTQQLLSELCTLGIGGPAKYYTEVKSVSEMQSVLAYCFFNKLRYFILGKGSNCLFDDRGFDGLVILNKIDYLNIEDCRVNVGTGYSFARLGQQTAKVGLTGLEFAAGIPATVGGAIFMNAGANGQETKDTLSQVTFINEHAELQIFHKDQLNFSYRTSSFQTMKGAIVEATFDLKILKEAKAKQKQIVDYRLKTQPYGEKSAGCAFRNPLVVSGDASLKTCMAAGALIEQAALKGVRVGGAEVSTLHGNFIINKDRATALDILNLIHHVKEKVKAVHGIDLHEEVWFVPYKENTSQTEIIYE